MAILKGREMVYNAFQKKIFLLSSTKTDQSDQSSQSEH